MITVGQLNTLVSILQGLPLAQLSIVVAEKGSGLADDAILAADVLGDVAAILPPPIDIYAEIAATLLALVAAATPGVTVTPDPNPIADGQTTEGRGGRNY